MEVTKRKTSVSRKGKRRFHHAVKFKNIIEDKSGEFRLSHHIDKKTGMYNGKQIFKNK